MMEVVLII